MLFDKSDLPALRARIESGAPAEAYRKMVAISDRLLTNRASFPTNQPLPLKELALVWQLTQDPRYAEGLRREVEWSRVGGTNAWAETAKVYWPLVYDIGYAALTAESRQWLHNKFVKAAERFQPSVAKLARSVPVFINYNWIPEMSLEAAAMGAAIAGEPGFKPEWLETAATVSRHHFTHGITENGAYLDHMVYFFYGMSLGVNMPANLTTWALHRKGYDLITGTHLAQMPEWMLYETIPPKPTFVMNIGDASLQPIDTQNVRLLLAMMPTNRAANVMAERVKDDAVAPFETIVLYREPAHYDPADWMPRARFFPGMNMVHMRGGWDQDAFAAFIQARWEWGHIHNDVGAFTLWSHGRYWAVDSGYGHGSTDAHNMVLIDGQGQPARSMGGDMPVYLDSPFVSLAITDATRSWGQSFNGHFDWLTLNYVDAVAYALRYFAVIWGDQSNGIPPYVIVHDAIRRDRNTHKYEWLMGTWNDHIIGWTNNRATITAPFNDRWLEGPSDTNDPAALRNNVDVTVTVPATTNYEGWVFARGDDNWRAPYLNLFVDGKQYGYNPMGGGVWGWTKLSRRIAPLKAGAHKISLRQALGASVVRLKWIMLTARTNLPAYRPELFNDDLTVSVSLDDTVAVTGGWHWVEGESSPSQMEVQFLRPAVTFTQDWYCATTRFFHAHPRLRAAVTSDAPNFLVVLYPHAAKESELDYVNRPNRYGFPHELRWPGAVDYIGDFKDTARACESGFFVVRCPTSTTFRGFGQYANPTKLPSNTCYFLSQSTFLDFAGNLLVAIRDSGNTNNLVSRYGLTASVICSGDTLAVDLLTDPYTIWQLERPALIRAWGPLITNVIVNGQSRAFTRDGDYIELTARSRVFVPIVQRIAKQLQAAIDKSFPRDGKESFPAREEPKKKSFWSRGK